MFKVKEPYPMTPAFIENERLQTKIIMLERQVERLKMDCRILQDMFNTLNSYSSGYDVPPTAPVVLAWRWIGKQLHRIFVRW